MKRNNKTVNNKTGYLILGLIIIVTAACMVGLRISNNRKKENSENINENSENGVTQAQEESSTRKRKLAPWEKYLYANIEDPTYTDVIYSDNYDMSFEGFKKYNVGNKGDVVTFGAVQTKLGSQADWKGHVKTEISVLSTKVYSDINEIKNSVSDSERLISYYGGEKLNKGCKYLEIEINIKNNNKDEQLFFFHTWDVCTRNDKYVAEQHPEYDTWSEKDKDRFDDVRSSYIVAPKSVVFCYDQNDAEDYNKMGDTSGQLFLVPITKEITDFKHPCQWVMVPGNGSITYKEIFILPNEMIEADNLTYGTQLIGAGGTYQNDQFCIFLNK